MSILPDGNSDTVPELDDAPAPPSVNNVQQSHFRTGIKLKSNSISEDTSDEQVSLISALAAPVLRKTFFVNM